MKISEYPSNMKASATNILRINTKVDQRRLVLNIKLMNVRLRKKIRTIREYLSVYDQMN